MSADPTRNYKIYGSEPSPYSVKVRSYFRYKGLPHDWINRSMDKMAEFQALAKLPLIPLVVTPDGAVLQDSTPIIEAVEAAVPSPSVHPDEPALRLLSFLIEEYADEWLNKPMFHYRWSGTADRVWASRWLALNVNPAANSTDHFATADAIRERMVPRLSFVGSHDGTRGQIESSFKRLLVHLDRHLSGRLYLMGSRPCLGDFGLAGQLYELSLDPTPGALMRELAPNVLTYVHLMLDPRESGPFEAWDALAETLLPVLREDIAAVFLPWTLANEAALKAGAKDFTATIEGRPFKQDAQKYHARSLAALRARAAGPDLPGAVGRVMAEAGLSRLFSSGEGSP